jgi:putative selenium metabolism hydrolase
MTNTTLSTTLTDQVKARVAERREEMIRFMREIVAIPSIMGNIGAVGQRVIDEMNRLGFEDTRFDHMGNVLGRIGSGPTVLVYDSHIDTVDIGDRADWEWDPFEGKIENGVFYARGAGDEKQSTPGMLYGLAIARDLGLLDGYSVYYFGNMEEDCDGIACQALVEVEGIRPDYVVVGEPTEMNVYRGHKGRVELKLVSKGRSAHAASNQLGENAIYRLIPVLAGIRDLNDQLHIDPFLGQGRITASIIQSRSPSLNAVPDECTLYVDRRLTFGESKEEALAQVEALIPHDEKEKIKVEIMQYDTPSYTGFVFPVEKYFPAWALPEEHPFVQAGLETSRALWGGEPKSGKLNFSTNAIYWMGKANIPTVIFAAGIETTAHSLRDQVPLDDLVRAAEWYALMPSVLKASLETAS